MTLQAILAELGFPGGVTLRCVDDVEMVMFFLSHDRHNPAVTQRGTLISVGTASAVGAKSRNPLHSRRDFDLNEPDSLDLIEDYLGLMVEKCECHGSGRRRFE